MSSDPLTPAPFSFEAVWPYPDEEVQKQVLQFWLTEGVLHDEQQARHRVRQLIGIAYTHDRIVAAVSTAQKVHIPQLNLNCFYYRSFVGGQHRVTGLRSNHLASLVLLRSYRLLNDRFVNGQDRDCVGLYMEVENDSLKRHRNQTVWSDFGANVVYIGQTPRGAHARVWYFDGSRINA